MYRVPQWNLKNKQINLDIRRRHARLHFKNKNSQNIQRQLFKSRMKYTGLQLCTTMWGLNTCLKLWSSLTSYFGKTWTLPIYTEV